MQKKSTKIVNGVNQLSPEMEEMRMEVVNLELKARYWKAQFEIRDYTLKAEAIQEEYDKYLDEQKKKNEALLKRFQESLKEAEDVVIPHTITPEDIENNPDLAEEGIGIGDKIGIPLNEK